VISLDAKVHVPEDVLYRELESEAVLLDTRSGVYFGLDPTGARMWSLLAQHGCIRPAYESLLGEYDVGEAQLQQDLLDLVEKLSGHGLLQVDDGG
jgi:hypothetical protein